MRLTHRRIQMEAQVPILNLFLKINCQIIQTLDDWLLAASGKKPGKKQMIIITGNPIEAH